MTAQCKPVYRLMCTGLQFIYKPCLRSSNNRASALGSACVTLKSHIMYIT